MDLLRALRANADVRGIAVTGHGGEDVADAARAAGFALGPGFGAAFGWGAVFRDATAAAFGATFGFGLPLALLGLGLLGFEMLFLAESFLGLGFELPGFAGGFFADDVGFTMGRI